MIELAWYWIAALIIAAILVLVAIGVPVAFSLGAVAVAGIAVFVGTGALIQLAQIAFSRADSHLFIIAPLFILMAAMVAYSGAAEALFTAAYRWLNRLPGALGASSIVACTVFAAVSGSSAATAATVGFFAVPEMMRHRYDKRFASGLVAAGGTLGILIPPSLSMIVFGIITETSIGKLFIAGIVPGLVLSLLLMLHVVLVARLRPGLAAPVAERFTWRQRMDSLRGGIWGVAALIVLVIGSIYLGVATPTESAAIGAAGAIALTAVSGRLTGGRLRLALLRSTETATMVVFLLIGGFTLSFLVSAVGIGQGLSSLLVRLHPSPWVVIVLLDLLLQLLGGLMDPMAIIVITMPILFPALVHMGFSPLWLGVNVTIDAEVAMLTPPVALNLFILKGVVPKSISMTDIIAGSAPFILTLIAGLAIIILFPGLSTWLPARAF